MQITLPNGIVLDSNGRWASGLTSYARRRGFDDITGFLATHPDGAEEYLLVRYDGQKEGQPIYASTSYESACVHIDALWMLRKTE